jgi:hypothetical protein
MSINSLKELIAVLSEKAVLLESVQKALEEERRCLIECRPEGLDEKTRDAEESISRLNKLNSRFRTLLARTGEELGLPGVETLSALIPAVEPQKRIQLKELQERCFSAAGAIGGIIALNQALIKNSLEIIGHSLSLFSNLLGGAETYGAAGRVSSGKAAAGIFCREI